MLIQNERTRRCTGTGRFFWDERIIEKRGQWLELIFIFLTLVLLIVPIVELLIVLVLLRHSFHLPSRTTDAAGSPGCSLKNVHP